MDILVVQTAFPGDVILTLPTVQRLKRSFSSSNIDLMVTPRAEGIPQNHPDLREVLIFDKHGRDSGLSGFLRMVGIVRQRRYDVAIVPHRSLRSASLVTLARIPRRLGFNRSAGRMLLTDTVAYNRSAHEIDRNLSLLTPLHINDLSRELPNLYPSLDDQNHVDRLLGERGVGRSGNLVAIAPGTVWNTKRWPAERFKDVALRFARDGCSVVVVGSVGDRELCDQIRSGLSHDEIISVAGRCTFLQSAELFRRCAVLVCNDSAPMHLAMAMRTPVVAIFGATVPAFGFAPIGSSDIVVETVGLECRPCSIHGGDECPIRTFECMLNISSERVCREVRSVLERHAHARPQEN